MAEVPLSDETRRVIFAGEALDNYSKLDAGAQQRIDNRFHSILTAAAPPSSFVRESIGNLDIIVAGDQPRIYTSVVEHIPRGNSLYHLIFVFYIDYTHDYPDRALGKYDVAAAQRTAEATALADVADVEAYLQAQDAMGPDAFDVDREP